MRGNPQTFKQIQSHPPLHCFSDGQHAALFHQTTQTELTAPPDSNHKSSSICYQPFQTTRKHPIKRQGCRKHQKPKPRQKVNKRTKKLWRKRIEHVSKHMNQLFKKQSFKTFLLPSNLLSSLWHWFTNTINFYYMQPKVLPFSPFSFLYLLSLAAPQGDSFNQLRIISISKKTKSLRKLISQTIISSI